MICSITVKLVFLKSHNNETWSIFTVGEWPTFGIKLVAFLKILPHFDCVHTIYTNYSALAHNFNNTVRGWSWKSSFCCWTEQGSRISILAGLGAFGAAFAHQLHAATADGERHCDLEKRGNQELEGFAERCLFTQRRMRRTKANMKQV